MIKGLFQYGNDNSKSDFLKKVKNSGEAAFGMGENMENAVRTSIVGLIAFKIWTVNNSMNKLYDF